jgi:ATP phosphoribosyltransferase-like protein
VPYHYVRTYGATKVFPPEDADLIVDNTASGNTLRANGLVVLDELLTSSSRLIANRETLADPARRAHIDELVLLLASILEGRRRVLLDMNVSAERLDAVIACLPAMKAPTIQALHEQSGFAVRVAVPRDDVHRIFTNGAPRGSDGYSPVGHSEGDRMNVRRMTTTQDTDPILPAGLKRVSPSAPEAEAVAREIIAAVRARGDDAVCEFTARFDDVRLAPEALRVPADAMKRAADAVDDDVRDALVHAIANIRKFHQTQMPDALALTEVEPGVWCGDRWTPLDTVCLYVPRGRGAFASVMCMLGAPAKIAGVGRIIVCTPPGPDGAVDPATLLAARVLGIDEIYRVGGAQAVAAVALGTEKIPRCDKIVGPGNVFVSAARDVAGGHPGSRTTGWPERIGDSLRGCGGLPQCGLEPACRSRAWGKLLRPAGQRGCCDGGRGGSPAA